MTHGSYIQPNLEFSLLVEERGTLFSSASELNQLNCFSDYQ